MDLITEMKKIITDDAELRYGIKVELNTDPSPSLQKQAYDRLGEVKEQFEAILNTKQSNESYEFMMARERKAKIEIAHEMISRLRFNPVLTNCGLAESIVDRLDKYEQEGE